MPVIYVYCGLVPDLSDLTIPCRRSTVAEAAPDGLLIRDTGMRVIPF